MAGAEPLSVSCQKELKETDIAISRILLITWDSTALAGVPPIVMVLEEPIPPATSLATILEQLRVCADLKIVERGIVTVNGREAGRIVLTTGAFGTPMKEIAYLFVQDNWMWSLIFVFAPQDEPAKAVVWQQIVESFVILP